MKLSISATTKSTTLGLIKEISPAQFIAASRQALEKVATADEPIITVSQIDRKGRGEPAEHSLASFERWLSSDSLNRRAWKNTLRITATISKPSRIGAGVDVTTISVDRSSFVSSRKLVAEHQISAVGGKNTLSLE